MGPQSTNDNAITTMANDQLQPRIAYSSISSQYMVVWEHVANTSDHDIYARQVGADGAPIGTEKALVYDSINQTKPTIAYNTTDNEYLLVWEHEYSVTDHDIYACRLDATANNCVSFIIASSTAYESSPTVTYNPDAHEYLVVYERKVGSDEFAYHELVAQRVSYLGTVSGSPITMISNSLDQRSPAAAYGSGVYMLTWQGKQPGSSDLNVYAQILAGSSIVPGGVLPVSTWEGDQLHPRLAYNNLQGHFLVVWEDHHWSATTGWTIYGLRLDAAGNPVNNQITIAMGGEKNRLNPDVAFNSQTKSYQVVWEFQYNLSGDYDIYCRRVAYDGTLPEVERVVINHGNPERAPVIASGASNTLLVAWEDSRNYAASGVDIYGSLMPVNLPIFTGFVYTGEKGDTSTPLSGTTLGLYCSSGSGVQGSLVSTDISNETGVYGLPSYTRCEFYNILETDKAGFYSTGSSTIGGAYKDNNWTYYTDPLDGKDLTGNNFWDVPQGPSDNIPPGNWANFTPAGWLNTLAVNLSVQVQDGYSGLAVGSAQYATSQDGGGSWTAWQPAGCTGSSGTISSQTISAAAVFGRDSGPSGPDQVRFRIQDVAGNQGQSPVYSLKIDTVAPLKPTILDCPSHPTSIWEATNLVSCQWSGASDALSGVGGYTVAWDQSIITLPGLTGASGDASVTTVPLSDGEWYFHVRTIDAAGNGSVDAKFYGPIRIDTTPPDAWFTTPAPGDVNNKQVTVSWTGTDSPSGINTYDVQKSSDATVWEDWYMNTTNQSYLLFGDHGQSISLRVRARDYAGNVGAWSPVVTVNFGVEVAAIVKDEGGNPLTNADVYLNGVFQGITNSNGTINLYQVLLGDEISARYLIAVHPAAKSMHHWLYGPSDWAYRTYITSLSFDNIGAPQRFLIANTAVTQVLTVRKTNTLVGFNVVVSVEWDANAAFLSDLEKGFQKASAYLFDVTDGQMYFEAVDIWDNKSYWDVADYHILAQNDYRANARVAGIWQGTDAHLLLGRGISWTLGTGFRTLIHEFGHYGFDLYDEYMDRNGKEYVTQCTIDRTNSSSDADVASFMDKQSVTSEMCSALTIHPHNPNTMQDAQRGGPAWNTVYDRYKDTNNPPRWMIIKPDDRGSIMPGPDSVPETGWSKTRTSGQSSSACDPIDTSWVYPDGTPALGFDTWVNGGNRSIYQGVTVPDLPKNPTAALITILGAYPGDTVTLHKDCGWFCSDSGSFTASCSNQAGQGLLGPGSVKILQRDPFSIEVSSQLSGDGVSLVTTVLASIPLSAPPQVQILQDGADVINLSLAFNGAGYTGTAGLNPSLPLSGRIIAQANDGQGHTGSAMASFQATPLASTDLTWVKSIDGKAEIFLKAGSLSGNPFIGVQPANPVSLTLGSYVVVGNSYTISASTGTSDLALPGTLNIYFSQDDLVQVNGSSIGLYRWEDSSAHWIRVDTTVDWDLPSASASVTKLGTYALLADTRYEIHLPVIRSSR